MKKIFFWLVLLFVFLPEFAGAGTDNLLSTARRTDTFPVQTVEGGGTDTRARIPISAVLELIDAGDVTGLQTYITDTLGIELNATADMTAVEIRDLLDTLFGGTAWRDEGADSTVAVDSVFGRTGVITAQSGDYTAALVGAATAAQGVLAETATQPADLGSAAALDAGLNIGNVLLVQDVGTCSDTTYTDQTTCEANSGTWTAVAGIATDFVLVDEAPTTNGQVTQDATNNGIRIMVDGTVYPINGTGGGDSVTVQAADPDSSSASGFYGATTSGNFFYKSDDGLFTITSTYVADPVTYSLTVDMVDGNGVDYFTYDTINYTTDQSFTGLTADASFTVTADTGREVSCTGTGLTDNTGGSYTAGTASADVTAVCTYSATSVAVTAPTNYWEFENDATDSVGTDDLTNNGTITYSSTSAPNGTYYALTPNSDTQNFSYADDDTLDIGDQNYSMSFWVYWERDTVYLYDKYLSSSTDGGLVIAVTSTGDITVKQQVGYNSETLTLATAVTANSWYHVVISYDSVAGTLTSWISTSTFGDLVNGTATAIGYYPAANTADTKIAWGSSIYATTNGVDDMAIWIGSTLTATEAQAIFDGNWYP